MTGTGLASGGLLVLMGMATVVVGLRDQAMPAPEGWQAEYAVRLQRVGAAVTDAFAAVPGAVQALLLVAVVAALVYRALRPSPELPNTRRARPEDPQLEEPHAHDHP